MADFVNTGVMSADRVRTGNIVSNDGTVDIDLNNGYIKIQSQENENATIIDVASTPVTPVKEEKPKAKPKTNNTMFELNNDFLNKFGFIIRFLISFITISCECNTISASSCLVQTISIFEYFEWNLVVVSNCDLQLSIITSASLSDISDTFIV